MSSLPPHTAANCAIESRDYVPIMFLIGNSAFHHQEEDQNNPRASRRQPEDEQLQKHIRKCHLQGRKIAGSSQIRGVGFGARVIFSGTIISPSPAAQNSGLRP
jgi:hypothetical protein